MPDNPALKSQRDLLELMHQLTELAPSFAADPSLERMNWLGEMLSGLEHPMRVIEFADDNDRAMELLRTLEIHGLGWVPFQARDFRFEKGDLLITATRSLGIVTAVNEKGEIEQVAASPGSKTIAAGDFVLTWRPVKQARRWLRPTEQAAPGYTDLDRALVYLVRQWGNTQSDNGVNVTTGVGFFLDVIRAPGLKLDPGDLAEYSDPADVLSFCRDRADGLQPFTVESPVVPGDVLRLKTGKAWAVVTRRSEKKILDALVGGLAGAPSLGEPKGAVRLVRAMPPDAIAEFWKPGKRS
jgi:hypothetical protein